MGFNDLKAIEIAGYAEALAGQAAEPFNFRAGWRVQRLVEAIQQAAAHQQWIDTAP